MWWKIIELKGDLKYLTPEIKTIHIYANRFKCVTIYTFAKLSLPMCILYTSYHLYV